jgi:hypothetical protein
MNLYVHLGDQIGTAEARDLAQRLVVWHDAMVKHARAVGGTPASACDEDCPHGEAAVLWAAAQTTFGARAQQLGFLRTHGQRRRMPRPLAGKPPDLEVAV